MVETLTTFAQYGSYVIAGIIVALTAIAPLTKTEWDNKALAAIVWLHDVVLVKVLPLHDVTAKQDPATPVTTPVPAMA